MRNLIALDANVILRFLIGNHSEHARQSLALFKKAAEGGCQLFLSTVVIAECVWVLQSFYKQSSEEVDRMLSALVSANYVKCDHKDVILRALDALHQLNVDFVDAYVAELAREERCEAMATFNQKHFRRFHDLKIYDWGEFSS